MVLCVVILGVVVWWCWSEGVRCSSVLYCGVMCGDFGCGGVGVTVSGVVVSRAVVLCVVA